MKLAPLQIDPTKLSLPTALEATSNTFAIHLTATRWSQLIDCKQLVAMTRMSRSKIYLLMNPSSRYFEESFPLPATFGRSKRWNLAQVEAWLAGKFEKREGGGL